MSDQPKPHVYTSEFPVPNDPLPPDTASLTRQKWRAVRYLSWPVLTVLLVIISFFVAYSWQQARLGNLQQQLKTDAQTILNQQKTIALGKQTAPSLSPTTPAGSVAKVSWSSLDSSMQQAITARWGVVTPGYNTLPANACTQPQNQTYWVESDHFGAAVIGCGNSELDFLVNVNGGWQLVASGQNGTPCATILQYGIPTSFVTTVSGGSARCVMPDGSPQSLGL